MPFPYLDTQSIASLYYGEAKGQSIQSSPLELVAVHLVHRHGERTPIFYKDNPAAPTEQTWRLCHLLPAIHAVYQHLEEEQGPDALPHSPEHPSKERAFSKTQVLKSPPTSPDLLTFSRILFQKQPGRSLVPETITQLEQVELDGTCFGGQLTDVGKSNMRHYGANLRNVYVHHLGFLSNTLKPQELYVRSTDYARTLESVQYLLNGLYPTQARTAGQHHIDIHIHTPENLYPQDTCAAMVEMSRMIRKLNSEQVESKIQQVSNRFSSLGLYAPATMRDLHRLYDHLICAQANGVKLPEGVENRDLDQLEDVCVSHWWNTYSKSEQVARLAIGRFVQDLKQQVQKCEQGKGPKLSIFSGHDSTVGPLLSAFQVFDGKFPPFGAMITFEQFKERPSLFQRFLGKSEHKYMRMSYNGKPLVLPHCAKPQHHRPGDTSLCTLDAFYQAMDTMIPKDYEKECQVA